MCYGLASCRNERLGLWVYKEKLFAFVKLISITLFPVSVIRFLINCFIPFPLTSYPI